MGGGGVRFDRQVVSTPHCQETATIRQVVSTPHCRREGRGSLSPLPPITTHSVGWYGAVPFGEGGEGVSSIVCFSEGRTLNIIGARIGSTHIAENQFVFKHFAFGNPGDLCVFRFAFTLASLLELRLPFLSFALGPAVDSLLSVIFRSSQCSVCLLAR